MSAVATPPPFAPGSVSFRIYPHDGLGATAVVEELCHQGALALRSGFDGVMTSEHHGGFGGYHPAPLQLAGFVLDAGGLGWAAPCPLLLPLRPAAMVAEEVAWLAARHPGRVGLGVAAGALPLDFEVMGVPAAEAVTRFTEALPRVVALLRGESLGPLAGDPALAACSARPVPVLSAAASAGAARRAARCGAGVLYEGMSAPERLAPLSAAYDAAGGTGAKVLIRRVWLGDAPADLIAAQRARYGTYAGDVDRRFGEDRTITDTDPLALAERLAAARAAAGADALNLRVHLPGVDPSAARSQIEELGSEVLPHLRAADRGH